MTMKTPKAKKVVAKNSKKMVQKPATKTNQVKKQPAKDIMFKSDKNTVVRPNCLYTENDVRGFLCLSKNTFVCPSKYTGMHVNNGLIRGSDIIAHLDRISKTNGRGRRSAVKIGRRYASGSVTVVAR